MLDIAITFDTTGSMYPCLAQVKQNVQSVVAQLLKDIPGIRIAVVAHGDYCDARSTYVTKVLDFTSNAKTIIDFVRGVERTGGGDSPECYELVLHQLGNLSWSQKNRVAMVIGDDVPHPVGYPENVKKLDWKVELGKLKTKGVTCYGVHAMPGCRQHSKAFYTAIGKVGGAYLTLDQFANAPQLILGACYQQQGTLNQYVEKLRSRGGLNANLANAFRALSGGAIKVEVDDSWSGDLEPVPAGRFQILSVYEKQPIKEFVVDNGCAFKTGRGFYEWTKREEIQDHKELVLVHRASGEIFCGSQVRAMLGLPPQTARGHGGSVTHAPDTLPGGVSREYRIFVQSTSSNRALVPGTDLMYEVEDWEASCV